MLAAVAISNLLTLLAASLGGLALCIFGLRGRRVGEEPYCRKCAYNLTGLTSERCPECGSPIAPDGIVHGTFHRRWAFIVVGALPLAVCTWLLGSLACSHLRMIDLYPHYPFSWLLADARQGRGLDFHELLRRERAGKLSQPQRGQLVEAALDAQAQRPPPNNVSGWLEALNRWDVDGVLTPKQRAQFHSQLEGRLTPTIQGPLKVRSGGRLSFTLVHKLPEVFPVYLMDCTFTIDGQVSPIAPQYGWTLKTPRRIWGDEQYYVPKVDLSPGRCRLEYGAKYEIFRPGWRPNPVHRDFSGSFVSVEIAATTVLEVLPPFDSEHIQLITDPAMEKSIKDAVKLQSIRATHCESMDTETAVHLRFRLEGALPAHVAFDVLLRLPDGDVHVGTMAWPKDAKAGHGRRRGRDKGVCGVIPRIEADEASVVLRTNPEAACLLPPDVQKIWDGEILLGPKYIWYEEQRSMFWFFSSPQSGAVRGNPP